MASPLLASRNSSYTSLCTLKDTAHAPRPAVAPFSHGHGMRRSATDPNLVARATKFTTGPSQLQRCGVRELEASAADGPSRSGQANWEQQQEGRLGTANRQRQVVSQQAFLHQESQRSAPASEESVASAGPSTRPSVFAAEGRFASLSRVLLVGQPGSMFRTLANRKWPSVVGPISLLVFLFGTVLALFAAVRGALVRKVKSCRCCKGFGVVRCRLCDGRGTVDWRAKFSYSETCPLCAAKRFVVCPDCGGHYHRRLFTHVKGAKTSLESFFPGTAAAGAGGGVSSRPLD
uniref:182394m n=1 Tax=Chlamydomonas reinhardtii TaxID=3055 RepID=D5LAY4_CHLRE|nr:182394m [Chlamydomonas reinhardtii]